MRKRAKLKREGIGWFCDCPICGHNFAVNETMPWCSKCGTEHGEQKTFEDRYATYSYQYVTFDTEKKTPRYAWGKALNLSGGIRIGSNKKGDDG